MQILKFYVIKRISKHLYMGNKNMIKYVCSDFKERDGKAKIKLLMGSESTERYKSIMGIWRKKRDSLK